MQILMISGTYNAQSKTHAVLSEAKRICDAFGVGAEIAELCDFDITSGQKDTRHDLATLIGKIEAADAVIIATPNYQGSMSGLLKVAIDHIPEHGLRHKAVGLISVSGGMGRMSQPISHLRDVVAALEGLAVSTAIACHGGDFEKDDAGQSRLTTPKLLARVRTLVEEIYAYVELVDIARQRGLA
ncbi:MAG: NADPH-dependent FMN reductase [Pseudomonadota bacterium]